MSRRFVLPLQQVFTNLGQIAPGYKLKTYATTTSTPLASYSDQALTIPNANPATGATTGNQIADANGRFGEIWMGNQQNYKIILTDENDVTIYTADPVNGGSSNTIIDFNPMPTAFWGTTTGTSSAYILSSEVNISNVGYANGQSFLINFHTACAANPKLTIDGLQTLNLKKKNNQGSKVSLISGDVNGLHLCENDGVDIIVLDPITQLLYLGSNTGITISNDTITVPNTASTYSIDTEASAPTDNVVSINGTVAGQVVVFGIVSGSRIPTFKHGTGNLSMQSGLDFTPRSISDRIVFISDGTNLNEISRSSAGTLGCQLLQTSTFSGATEAIFNDPYIFSNKFSRIVFEFEFTVSTSGSHLSARFSNDGGAAYISANYVGQNVVSAVGSGPVGRDGPTFEIDIISSVNSISNTSVVRVNVELKNPSNTTLYKSLQMSEGSYVQSSGEAAITYGSGKYNGSTLPINAIRFFPSSGTFSGTIKVRGYI